MAELKPKKAYKVWLDCGEGSTVVFADTRNEAKVIALSCDCCEDAEYIEVCVRRMQELDHLYKGQSEIDWWDKETRVALVRDHGWSCFDPYYPDCEECPAKEFCEQYKDMTGDMEQEVW